MDETNEKSKGKILYLHAGSELYGADRILLELVKGMSLDRWNPIVILPNEGPLITEMQKVGIEVLVLPFPVLRRKYFNLRGLVSYFFGLVKYTIKLIRIIKQRKIDVVHSNTLAVIPGLLAAYFSKTPHVWHVHEIITKPKVFTKLISRMAHLSNRIVTVSKAVRYHLIANNKKISERTTVIYNGIDSEKYKPYKGNIKEDFHLQVPKDKPIFGMIGRINSWKGQMLLLEAAEKVFKKVPNSHCMFVGGVFENDTYFRDQLISAISSKNLENQVTVLGFQPNPEKVHPYFDVFVLPSTEPDPLPTVVLEAMATGVPLVANAHGGAVEMIDNQITGFLVDVNNSQAMAEKITYLLNNPLVAKKMGQDGRDRVVKLFSNESFFRNFSSLYQEMINEH